MAIDLEKFTNHLRQKAERLAAFALALTCALSPALAKDDQAPRIVHDPVFGLRYALAKAGFEPVPSGLPPKCKQYAGLEDPRVGKLFIFATAHHANQTYYVVGGYWKPRSADPSRARYEIDESGGVIAVEGDNCVGLGAAREVFEARFFKDIPQLALQQLADDLAARLLRAAGSPSQLRARLRSKQVNRGDLPEELKEAFKTYFP